MHIPPELLNLIEEYVQPVPSWSLVPIIEDAQGLIIAWDGEDWLDDHFQWAMSPHHRLQLDPRVVRFGAMRHHHDVWFLFPDYLTIIRWNSLSSVVVVPPVPDHLMRVFLPSSFADVVIQTAKKAPKRDPGQPWFLFEKQHQLWLWSTAKPSVCLATITARSPLRFASWHLDPEMDWLVAVTIRRIWILSVYHRGNPICVRLSRKQWLRKNEVVRMTYVRPTVGRMQILTSNRVISIDLFTKRVLFMSKHGYRQMSSDGRHILIRMGSTVFTIL